MQKKLSDFFKFDENGEIQYIGPKITDPYPKDRSPKTPEPVVKDLKYSPRFCDSAIRQCSQIENCLNNEDHFEVELDDSDSGNSEMDVGPSNEGRVIEILTFEAINVAG